MTTQLSPTPVQKFFDNNGNPLFNGQLFTYAAGTSTPQATYTDSTGATQNTNPVILNARGEANIWLNPSLAYKYVLEDSVGNQIWAIDNILGSSGINASVSNVTALRAYYGTLTGQIVFLQGYTTQNDGGQGPFQWGAYATDNGGTIITPTGQVAGSWYRIYSSYVDESWFSSYSAFASFLANSGLLGINHNLNSTQPGLFSTVTAENLYFHLFQHYEAAAAPFAIGTAYLTNTDYTRNDQIYTIGYNASLGGNLRYDSSEPEWALHFESFWEQPAQNLSVQCEWYLQFVSSDNAINVRPIAFNTIRQAATGYPVGYTTGLLQVSEFYIGTPNTGSGPTELVSLSLAAGNITLWNGLSIYSDTNNAWILQGANFAGNTIINILKIDTGNNIQIGENGTNINVASVINAFAGYLTLNYGGNPVLTASGSQIAFFGGTMSRPAITGALSSVTDANAKAVLTSIIAALDSAGVNLVTNSTT